MSQAAPQASEDKRAEGRVGHRSHLSFRRNPRRHRYSHRDDTPADESSVVTIMVIAGSNASSRSSSPQPHECHSRTSASFSPKSTSSTRCESHISVSNMLPQPPRPSKMHRQTDKEHSSSSRRGEQSSQSSDDGTVIDGELIVRSADAIRVECVDGTTIGVDQLSHTNIDCPEDGSDPERCMNSSPTAESYAMSECYPSTPQLQRPLSPGEISTALPACQSFQSPIIPYAVYPVTSTHTRTPSECPPVVGRGSRTCSWSTRSWSSGQLPDDASKYELVRDAVLRAMTRRCFVYLVLFWALNVVGWGIWAGVLYFFDTQMPVNVEEHSGVSVWGTKGQWINVSTHIEIALFTCFNLVNLPWRWANMIHLWFSTRPNAVGLDFYGRPAGSIWFYIPHSERKRIVTWNLLSIAFHVVLQSCRAFLWSDYKGAHEMPGTLVINIALTGTIGLGVCAGVYQGQCEGKLRKQHPDIFAPAAIFYVMSGYKKWRDGGNGSMSEIARHEYRAFIEDRRKQTMKCTNPLTNGVLTPNAVASRGWFQSISSDTLKDGSFDERAKEDQTRRVEKEGSFGELTDDQKRRVAKGGSFEESALEDQRRRVQRAASANLRRNGTPSRCSQHQTTAPATVSTQEIDTADYAV